MSANRTLRPWVLILFGAFILWGFGWETIGLRLEMQANGVIVAEKDVPPSRSSRYATEYTLRAQGGTESILWAGATDASLPRDMPIGTRIDKRRWHLGYKRDGKFVSFDQKYFYALPLACGLGLIVWGGLMLRSVRRSK